jgi:transcriptional regulator with XRE-family HTH domain
MKTFGDRIREFREAKDKSLRELARELEVSAAFLSDVELGRRYPSDDVLDKLAARLGTTADELRQFDTRPPIDDLKRRSVADPAYGFALRKIVEHDIGADELMKIVERHRKEEER